VQVRYETNQPRNNNKTRRVTLAFPTCQVYDSRDVPPRVLGDAGVVAKVVLAQVVDGESHLNLVARLSLLGRHGKLSPRLYDPSPVMPEGQSLGVRLDEAGEGGAATAEGARLLVRHPHHGRNWANT
jgi:hypothetical protein